MKSKLLMFGLSAAALATPAMADKTFRITGATAFRQAAILTIESLYDAGYGATSDKSTTTGADSVTYVGKMTSTFGATETITVQCRFKGSVEGLSSITSNNLVDQPVFIPAASVTPGVITLNTGVASETAFADYSFSDVAVTSSPFGAVPVYPGPDSSVGVVVFTMITNDGSPITNVNSQNFRALFSKGRQPTSMFTGNPADVGQVVASGRNDGSGTRTTYLAETGYGIVNLVNQYYVSASTGDNNDSWAITPAASAFSSTVWDQDTAGNGGYASGGDLRSVLARKGTTSSIVVGGFPIFTGQVDTVSFLSLSDAISSRDTGGSLQGAKFCKYNGVGLDDIAVDTTPPIQMSANDTFKITNGAYTAWGNQQFYGRDGTSGDKVTFFDAIVAGVDTNLGTAGVSTGLMVAQRPEDGGVVSP